MQYIQLQGQVAADLDLPLQGSYNLFIDTSDNTIKAKDSEGNLTGGGGGLSLIEVSRHGIEQLVASASLTPGAFYKITGVASASFYEANSISYTGYGNEIQDGGSTIILQAATEKTLSKKGIGLFYVPNYENPNYPTAAPDTNYNVWDYTNRLYFDNLSGIFDHEEYVYLNSANTTSGSEGNLVANIGNNSLTFVYDSYNDKFLSNPDNLIGLSITGSSTHTSASIVDFDYTSSYNAGDCVIWGGRVWQNRSGSVGYTTGGWPYSQLTLNDEDWTKIPFNETNYTIVADLIEYEFEWDNISYRKSANNLEVRCDAKIWIDYWGYNTMKYFPWGHKNIVDINISNSYLDAFVNYPENSSAGNITFKDFGGFNAHYWGHRTQIDGISSDIGGHLNSLNLGYNTQIYNITLGVQSRISDIYTYDNDNGYDVLQDIIIGDNAQISGYNDNIYMYHNSYMENLILETNSEITDINLYNGASIRDTKLGISSYMSSIALGPDSDFRQVELGNSSYIQNINTDVSACFKRVKLGIDSNINYFGIGYNGYFKHIEMGDQSAMYCNVIGDYSYFQYVNLGINSEIYLIDQTAGNSNFEHINVGIDSSIHDIELGVDGSFNHITLGSDSSINNIDASGSVNAYVRHIDIKNSTVFGDISMEDSSYIRRMDIGSDSEVGGITLTGGTNISDFSISNDSGFGGFDILASSSLSNFEIGQDSGFCCSDITSSMYGVTISRGFNNFRNNQTFIGISGSAHSQQSDLPYIDFSTKGVVVLDITDFPADTVNYRLSDGDYEGQEITFVVRNNSVSVLPGPTDVRIWADNLQYPIQYNQYGYVTYCSFAPFAHYSAYDGGNWVWRTMGKAIWTNGAWVTDAEFYYD
jgi:hypothetical protein